MIKKITIPILIFSLLLNISFILSTSIQTKKLIKNEAEITTLKETITKKDLEITEQLKINKITEELLTKHFKDTMEYNNLQHDRKMAIIENYIKTGDPNKDDKTNNVNLVNNVIDGMYEVYRDAEIKSSSK